GICIKVKLMIERRNDVDWRRTGALTPICNQGSECGCCWAFASVATAEAIYFIRRGVLISLFAQELIDCCGKEGCRGGSTYKVFSHMMKHNIASAVDYPYKGVESPCQEMTRKAISIDSFGYVPKNNELALEKAVRRQPVYVGIAMGKAFMDYKGGIFEEDCMGKQTWWNWIR
ncbi:hypothetical protein KI387_009097, partial [Taxus chinensis]